MKRLYVFYDQECALCKKARNWLSRQPSFIPMFFIPFQSEVGPRMFPGLRDFNPAEELLVISDAGAVYQGSRAWIMCLYATKEFRGISIKMAQPGWRHLAKKMVHTVSENRYALSTFFAKHFVQSEVVCEDDRCGT